MDLYNIVLQGSLPRKDSKNWLWRFWLFIHDIGSKGGKKQFSGEKVMISMILYDKVPYHEIEGCSWCLGKGLGA